MNLWTCWYQCSQKVFYFFVSVCFVPCSSIHPFLYRVPSIFPSVPSVFSFVFCGSHNSYFIPHYPSHKTGLLHISLFLSWPQKPTSLSRLASVIILLKLYLMIFLNPFHFSRFSSFFLAFFSVLFPIFPYPFHLIFVFLYSGRHCGATRTPIYAHALYFQIPCSIAFCVSLCFPFCFRLYSLQFPFTFQLPLNIFSHTHIYLPFEALNSFPSLRKPDTWNTKYKAEISKLRKIKLQRSLIIQNRLSKPLKTANSNQNC